MKAILTLLVVCAASFAQANDGGTVFLDVKGIQPGNLSPTNPDTDKFDNFVSIYGKEMKKFFDIVPANYVLSDEIRGVSFASKAYVAYLFCGRDYISPVSDASKSDHSCSFMLEKSNANNNYKVPGYAEGNDGDWGKADFESFTSYVVDPLQVNVPLAIQGYNPNNNKLGTLFSFYGNDTEMFAKALPYDELGDVYEQQFISGKYVFSIECSQMYVRPTTGKMETDYKCSFSAYKK